jgi:hypothetical protein
METTEHQTVPEFAVSHYSVNQVAKMWGVSEDTIRRIFEKEPDVLILGERFRGSRRTRRILRIPANVIERVHRQRQNK